MTPSAGFTQQAASCPGLLGTEADSETEDFSFKIWKAQANGDKLVLLPSLTYAPSPQYHSGKPPAMQSGGGWLAPVAWPPLGPCSARPVTST